MLIENKNEIHPKIINAHGGDGTISISFFHTEQANYVEGASNDFQNPNKDSLWNFFAYAELDVDNTVKNHRHNNTDEIYYILDGEADITVDGETKKVKCGDVILTRAGSSHSIEKVIEKLKFIAVEILVNE